MQQSKQLRGELSPEIHKRTLEIQLILNSFVEDWHRNKSASPLILIEGAAQKLSEKYFELLEGTIKEYLKKGSKVNKFKVASGSEIATMFVLPIKFSDESYNYMDRCNVNARFGITLAISLMFSIYYEHTNDVDTKRMENDGLFEILDAHRSWLSRINKRELGNTPTLINSGFWQVYFYASTGKL